MIQSFGSQTTFGWYECGKNPTLGVNESNPGCFCCLILCDVCAEEEETVECDAWLDVCSAEVMMGGKEKGTYQLYNAVQPDSRILIAYGKHLVCS
jgi:hypothetical protein